MPLLRYAKFDFACGHVASWILLPRHNSSRCKMHGSNFALSDTRVLADAVDGRFRYVDDVAAAAVAAAARRHNATFTPREKDAWENSTGQLIYAGFIELTRIYFKLNATVRNFLYARIERCARGLYVNYYIFRCQYR